MSVAVQERNGTAGSLAARVIVGAKRRRIVLYAFVASRLMLLAIGLMTHIFLEPVSHQTSPVRLAEASALRMWGQWDSGWYMALATHGYASAPGADGQVNWAFFPAFPMISAWAAKLTGLPLFSTMLLVSNLCFLAALFLAHRLAERTFGERRTADLTVALLCAAPGSYIFSSAYTESLFLLAVTACLWLLTSRRWIAAGAAAALAVLTRNIGVGLVLPFLLLAALRLREAVGAGALQSAIRQEALRMAIGLALPALALAGFCLALYQVSGDPFAFVTAQKAWGRSLLPPFVTALIPFLPGKLPPSEMINFAACWLSLAMLAALALMRRWALLALAAFMVLVPLSAGLTSYARYCLVALPLFLAGAHLLARRPAAALSVLICLAMLNGFMMALWTLGMWVTV